MMAQPPPNPIAYGDKQMHQFRPTSETAQAARDALSAAGVKARVRTLRFSVRVCLEGELCDATRALAAAALSMAGLSGVMGSPLAWERGYQAFAYAVR